MFVVALRSASFDRFLCLCCFQDEDLKWVEENIPTTVADVYVSHFKAVQLITF